MGTVFDLVIPDGPLHPTEVVWGLGAGLLVAAAARRRLGPWIALVLFAVVAVVGCRFGNAIVEGYADRPDTARVVALTVLIVGGAGWRPTRMTSAAPSAIAACVAVWAVVPDTEVPLIGAAVLVSAGVRFPTDDHPRRGSGVLVVIPVAAAVVGSVGRPDRLGPALLVGSLAIGVALVAVGLVRRWFDRRQRAGTPTTVAPAATSSMTTAPAPTTAP